MGGEDGAMKGEGGAMGEEGGATEAEEWHILKVICTTGSHSWTLMTISNGGLEMGEENDRFDFREASLEEKKKSFQKLNFAALHYKSMLWLRMYLFSDESNFYQHKLAMKMFYYESCYICTRLTCTTAILQLHHKNVAFYTI